MHQSLISLLLVLYTGVSIGLYTVYIQCLSVTMAVIMEGDALGQMNVDVLKDGLVTTVTMVRIEYSGTI